MWFTVVGIVDHDMLAIVTITDDTGVWPYRQAGLRPWIWQGPATAPNDAADKAHHAYRAWRNRQDTDPWDIGTSGVIIREPSLTGTSAARTVKRRWYNPRTWW